MPNWKKLLLSASILVVLQSAGGKEIFSRSLGAESDLKNSYDQDKKRSGIEKQEDGSSALAFTVAEGTSDKASRNVVSFLIDGKKIRGRRIRFTGEYRKELLPPLTRWGGGQFTFMTPVAEKKALWDHSYIGYGKSGWTNVEKIIDFPLGTKNTLWSIGVQSVCGKIYFRNLNASDLGAPLSFDKTANMGFVDKIAGDGKGGWSDQGPGQDGRRFPKKRMTFANVPFRIVDPEKNGGKSIMVFRCPKLPDGLEQAEINLTGANMGGNYLYLLHASAWGQEKGTPLGIVELYNENGRKHEFIIRHGEDVSDSFLATPRQNAHPAVSWAAGDCRLSAFVSKFKLPEKFGSVEKIVFRNAKDAKAMWIVVSATLSDTDYEYPREKMVVMKENEIWKALPNQYIPAPKAGTALDLSPLFPQEEAGIFGRVVIRNGKFVFEKKPDEPLRFLAVGTGRDYGKYFGELPEIGSKEKIEAYVAQMKRGGYNMVRFWVEQLRTGKEMAFEYNKALRDKHDYFVYCLKKNGIYIFYSLPNPTFGFDKCDQWSDPRIRKNSYNPFLNKKDREAWLKGAEKLLTEVNPYTKTRLIDDPVLAMIDCNNEQEFYFLNGGDHYAGIWREFLKKKYSTFSALQKAWGNDADGLKKFEDIRSFTPLGSDCAGQKLRDKAEFITGQERSLFEWEQAGLRKLGWKGPVTSFLMGKSMANSGVRKDFDFVSMNSYHAHPFLSESVTKGGRVSQVSSIGNAANIIRSFLGVRLYGKPFVISEHGHVFWNKYRYEQGFIMGGYGALNDLDVMTAFFMPVTTNPNHPITPFEIRHDPILRASELLTALMFRRRDVKSAIPSVRVSMNLEDAIRKNVPTDSIHSEQLKIGLVTRFHVDQTVLPMKRGELLFERIGGSKTAVRTADSNIMDSGSRMFDADAVVSKMKAEGTLAASNRTNISKNIYESSTGEILMDSNRKYMKITAPRFQGICGEAGTTSILPNLEIRGMNRRANIALASIDGMKDLNSADRLLLTIATNVLNTEMSFESENQETRIHTGRAPLLLETGKFELAVKTEKPLKCWALALDGTRIAEIPLKRSGKFLEISLNTAKIKNGPSLYFELAEK